MTLVTIFLIACGVVLGLYLILIGLVYLLSMCDVYPRIEGILLLLFLAVVLTYIIWLNVN